MPSAKDNFRAGVRALRGNQSQDKKGRKSKGRNEVGYARVSAAQDVDWEGEDVRDSLGAVLRMALEEGVHPVVEERQPLPFELSDRGGEESICQQGILAVSLSL